MKYIRSESLVYVDFKITFLFGYDKYKWWDFQFNVKSSVPIFTLKGNN